MRRQSEHLDDYRAALAQLEAAGPDLPELREPRRDRAPGGRARGAASAGRAIPTARRSIPGRGERIVGRRARRRRIAAGEPYALRLDMAAAHGARRRPLSWSETGAGPAARPARSPPRREAWGDVVLARKETPTSYHLSVVVDDALQGVTHVVRGQDLFWSTSVHRLLQALLGLPAPIYHHHRLILDADGPQAVEIDARDGACANCGRKGTTPADIRETGRARPW